MPPLVEPPPRSDSTRATRRRASRWILQNWAFQKFEGATDPAKRIAVPDTPEAQTKATSLIARGCCAYRSRDGVIRDVGVPRKKQHRGKVWQAPPLLRARDSRERALLLRRLKYILEAN